jgi:hypothetical protein
LFNERAGYQIGGDTSFAMEVKEETGGLQSEKLKARIKSVDRNG